MLPRSTSLDTRPAPTNAAISSPKPWMAARPRSFTILTVWPAVIGPARDAAAISITVNRTDEYGTRRRTDSLNT